MYLKLIFKNSEIHGRKINYLKKFFLQLIVNSTSGIRYSSYSNFAKLYVNDDNFLTVY